MSSPDTPQSANLPAAEANDEIPLIVNGRKLNAVEIQALREAKARRRATEAENTPREVGGANRTTEPTRYGDWEKAGRAVDFS